MKRYWFALAVALFFYAKTDILIWQRIFETHELWDIGIGVYHWGWLQTLFGFMVLGTLVSYPNIRRMILFPISLYLLATSGLEDILYYWLDGRAVPAYLPWLNTNPILLKPVTSGALFGSAIVWLAFVIILYIVAGYLERKILIFRKGRSEINQEEEAIGSSILPQSEEPIAID